MRFVHDELREQVEAFAMRWPDAKADRRGFVFVAPTGEASLRVPLAATRVEPGENACAYAARLRDRLERQVIVLLQAGACALGYWDGDELLAHKAMRKYVVRGHGKAQPTYSKTHGKSRYGARLRLQNWRRLLVATNERLQEYWHEFGAPERVFYAAPVRGWVELFTASPPPPLRRDAATLQRVPMHVHRPDFAELLRVRGWLLHGRVELPG